MLLDQSNTFVGQFSFWVNSLGLLDEHTFTSGGLEVLSEDSSAFGDDGGGFIMFKDLLFKFFSFFSSGLVKSGHVSVVLGHFSFLLFDDSSEDFSLGVEFSFELGFELDSQCGALSDVFIVGGDVVIAGFLE